MRVRTVFTTQARPASRRPRRVLAGRRVCSSRRSTTTSTRVASSPCATLARFAVVGEIDTHGIDPHEVAWLPDGRSLLVANGGIMTHPRTFRRKLNIPTMDPSLCVLDAAQRRVPRAMATARSSAQHSPPRAGERRHAPRSACSTKETKQQTPGIVALYRPATADLRLLDGAAARNATLPGLRRERRDQRSAGSDRRGVSVRRRRRVLVAARRTLSRLRRGRRKPMDCRDLPTVRSSPHNATARAYRPGRNPTAFTVSENRELATDPLGRSLGRDRVSTRA